MTAPPARRLPPPARARTSRRRARPADARQVGPPGPLDWRGLSSLLLALLLAALPSAAEELAEDPVFEIERFEISYAEPAPDLPPLSELTPFEVLLARDPDGWRAPTGDAAITRVVIASGQAAGRYHASAISLVTSALLERLQQQGLVGVFVAPHPADIDVLQERDLRPPGQTSLRIQILIGRVRELRSVASGDRIEESWKINNPAHRAIRQSSPIQPAALVRKGTTDIVHKRELEDYLFRLNRHSGRRVEAALAGAEGEDGIALDLRVYEARPWFAYAQSSNTGTPQTAVWQQRFGVVHRQLTGRDDVLAMEYTNAGIDKVHVFDASYEAPWFGAQRPNWWKSKADDPIWWRWIDRDSLPWWGVDRLRWRVNGSWSRYDAKNVGLDNIRGDEWNVGSRLIYETLQFGNLFVDSFFGLKLRHVSLFNESFDGTSSDGGDELFFLPELGIRFDRIQETSTFNGFVSFEVNVSGTFDEDLQNLGRADVDGDWQLLRYDLGFSQYLEPLLFPKAWEDPSTPRSSTLSHEIAAGFRGQYAFDYRLIPQASQVVGGIFSVRGYDPSESVGDSVWVATLEYRFHLPRALPIQREPVRVPLLGDFRAAPQQVYGRPDWDFVIKAFIDAGKTIRNQPSDPTIVTGEEDDTLLGVGIGGEFRFRHNLTVRVDWGHALRSAGDIERGNNEVYFLFNVVY